MGLSLSASLCKLSKSSASLLGFAPFDVNCFEIRVSGHGFRFAFCFRVCFGSLKGLWRLILFKFSNSLFDLLIALFRVIT